MCFSEPEKTVVFYDNSILPGTKIFLRSLFRVLRFYDNSILPGTKIVGLIDRATIGFTITQFFQVLKYTDNGGILNVVLR